MGIFKFLKRITLPANQYDTPPQDALSLFEAGTAQEAEGKIIDAIKSYRAAIHANPKLAQAHFNLGILLLEQDTPHEAIAAFRAALLYKPDSATCHYNLGNAYLQDGNAADSIGCYEQALALKPDFVSAEIAKGVALQETGLLEEAIACFQRVLKKQPDYAEVYFNLGGALREAHQSGAATAAFLRATEILPDYADAHAALGNILFELGEYQNAIQHYETALTQRPNWPELQRDLGQILRITGQLNKAISAFRLAVRIKPNFAEAYGNLGMALHQVGDAEGARDSYQTALKLNPKNIDALNNLGILWLQVGELEMAEASFRELLKLAPGDIEALNNLGLTLSTIGALSEAEIVYRRILEIHPEHAKSHSNLLFIHNYLSGESASKLFEEASRYGIQLSRTTTPPCFQQSAEPDRCLRVGIVSADLRQHPVGYFAENVLKHLSAQADDRIKLFVYSNHWLVDATTESIKACCQGWELVNPLDDERLAQRIRDDQIDILIDLSGHTADNRLPVFALKPAPVQVTWLGYFATTGVKEIDYLIADPWTLPESEEHNFTETIWRLPETRLCFTPPREVTEIAPLPALSTGKITFGCFNNLTKMNDEVVELWSRIIAAIPNSQLFLKSRQFSEPSVRETVIERFGRCAITPDRLIFEAYSPRTSYLASYNLVDIALDPFPYPGGTTTVEALWMGVPVLTLSGKSFLARQGVGLLMNAGLPDWVADTPNDYVARAVTHASDLQGLAALRAGLREQVLTSPVFDSSRFAHYFEEALRGMWKKWCQNA